MKGWKNKLRSVVKGPSWIPGLSWTGHDGKRASVMDVISDPLFYVKIMVI